MIEIQNKILEGTTFIDLFCGIGGFRLALESLGSKCVYSSEIDKYACKVYQDNFGDMPSGDITKEFNIPDHDILCGGFPCQAFTACGNQLGFNDARGKLFFEIVRIAKDKQPKIMLLENTANLLFLNGGQVFKTLKEYIYDAGYNLFYQILDAADYGVPQHRERLFMVCIRKDLEIKQFDFPKPVPLTKHIEDILLTEGIDYLYRTRDDAFYYGRTEYYTNKPINLGYVATRHQGDTIHSIKGVAITLLAKITSWYLVDGRIRRLHPRECARLMGFPDTYKLNVSNKQAHKCLGNSVVVDVIQYIMKGFENIDITGNKGNK